MKNTSHLTYKYSYIRALSAIAVTGLLINISSLNTAHASRARQSVMGTSTQSAGQASDRKNANSKTLKISGMDCKACSNSISANLKKLPEVEKAEVDFEKGIAVITPKSGMQLDMSKITTAISSAGDYKIEKTQ